MNQLGGLVAGGDAEFDKSYFGTMVAIISAGLARIVDACQVAELGDEG